MSNLNRQGVFEVIESFAITRLNVFYLIGTIKEGTIQANWFVNVPLNRSLSMTIRIHEIEEVLLSSQKQPLTLLIVNCEDQEMTELLLAQNINSESLDITIEGLD